MPENKSEAVDQPSPSTLPIEERKEMARNAILAGKMTDKQIAETYGFEPNNVSGLKGRLVVQGKMPKKDGLPVKKEPADMRQPVNPAPLGGAGQANPAPAGGPESEVDAMKRQLAELLEMCMATSPENALVAKDVLLSALSRSTPSTPSSSANLL